MNARFFSTYYIRSVLKLSKFKINNSILSKDGTHDLYHNASFKRNLAQNTTQGNHLPVRDSLSRRSIHTKVPKTPDLIYIPHIMRWLKTKFRFKLLQKTWDPEFSEGSFIYGTSRAICKITEIIHENNPQQLQGLLTSSALIKLKDDMSTKLSKVQKLIIKIRPEDIKILVPMTVVLNKDGEHKNCRIAMRVLALKWIQQKNGSLRLVLVALQTEFLRDYTSANNVPDWIISSFDVLECTVLAKA